MNNDVHQISLLPDHKWIRFFRFQMAVRQTANNQRRLAAGKGQVGRPRPRLVSLDFEDIFQVPVEWTVLDARDYAQRYDTLYVAVFIDGAYHVVPNSAVSADIIQACLNDGKIMVLSIEGTRKW